MAKEPSYPRSFFDCPIDKFTMARESRRKAVKALLRGECGDAAWHLMEAGRSVGEGLTIPADCPEYHQELRREDRRIRHAAAAMRKNCRCWCGSALRALYAERESGG